MKPKYEGFDPDLKLLCLKEPILTKNMHMQTYAWFSFRHDPHVAGIVLMVILSHTVILIPIPDIASHWRAELQLRKPCHSISVLLGVVYDAWLMVVIVKLLYIDGSWVSKNHQPTGSSQKSFFFFKSMGIPGS